MMRYLFDQKLEHSSCGVGFITHKQGVQTHQLLQYAHQALCKIPHRGGMNAEGIGDGAGVNIDISEHFFRQLSGNHSLVLGEFGVANFFYPRNTNQHDRAEGVIDEFFQQHELAIFLKRDVDVDVDALNQAAAAAQLRVRQILFKKPEHIPTQDAFETLIYHVMEAIEGLAFADAELDGFYPLSMSSRTLVYKGRLNSWEVFPYFKDLTHPENQIHTLFFHTRFSTNTSPTPLFAQPFRRMAHNGELNTDRKNRLSEEAIARSQNRKVIFPKDQSDSARLDQTLARRIIDDQLDIDLAVLAMMPPAWENDDRLPDKVRDMLAYFSLYEEKNDGPAALIFGDGVKVGARLDRLGLRPLRTTETDEYLSVMSEAGQIDFPAETVVRRGRIEAGGMIVYDQKRQRIEYTNDVLERLADEQDYSALLQQASFHLRDIEEPERTNDIASSLNLSARHVAYSLNQESFKFLLDPMLQTGMEKISAMGYGLAPNALSKEEGGMSRYFSQRFAQVTNPPLDSIREVDGMALQVALGAKPNFGDGKGRQLVVPTPVLLPQQLAMVCAQEDILTSHVETLFLPDFDNTQVNENNLMDALNDVADQVETLARSNTGIIILTDQAVSHQRAALPAMLVIAATNQRLIKKGLRFNASLVFETGQAVSSHDIACLLGFGASAVCPLSVYHRALELFSNDSEIDAGLKKFQKAAEKALMKTMGKFGLCTAESYIGGEFFESNFIDTSDPHLKPLFPNIHSPVGGARFADIAQSAADWHQQVLLVQSENEIPLLGLFKERFEGAGHSFGNAAVREYISMTVEPIQYVEESEQELALFSGKPNFSRKTPDDESYLDTGFEARSPQQIDHFNITSAYREFSQSLHEERVKRPAALRDVLQLPTNFSDCHTSAQFTECFKAISLAGNRNYAVQGLSVRNHGNSWRLILNSADDKHYMSLTQALRDTFSRDIVSIQMLAGQLLVEATGQAEQLLKFIISAPNPISLSSVQPAHEITALLASGAMSHGALVARAHEAVAHGTNIAGAMSNSGEGGENSQRYNSVRSSKIKQFASGRFGVWAGYLADPMLEEIEIKIAQGAKPGEGGQLPSAKVTVDIAAARGGTPGVELVSPPPHHDTYSIEDLGQLIHDAKAARVRVIVKLVSSEGVGTIAVGVAKAGADVINIAGNTGGTGAAQVTSLKNTGRAADLGIAEVHQALAENGLRDKVILRCSNAHQTGMDVVKSAILGGDSFEFGTTALMMLKCVMAKNCNLKCPAGLTTNPEVFQGDPRALAQYFINLAHEVREVLAQIGFTSLREIRGKTDLLNLINHPNMVGQLDMSAMLRPVNSVRIADPVYLQADFTPDASFIEQTQARFLGAKKEQLELMPVSLNNCHKSIGGQLSIDIERYLNYQLDETLISTHPAIDRLENGRVVLRDSSLLISTNNSAGQSYGAFNNTGITLTHQGTCNDGVGKSCGGGRIIIKNPGGGGLLEGENVLVGNFSLFGATGGELFVEGQAGDRFGIRNSGAVAVVEGVGDFCCEYMTNGSIVNLGCYGKGFGNGMSGGTAYQYDVSSAIAQRCSLDSVKVSALEESSELMLGHEQALLFHLQAHLEHTGSDRVQVMLDNWEESRRHFYVLTPRSLYDYHCSESIIVNAQRKTLLEELSQAWGQWKLRQIRDAYQDFTDNQRPLFGGQVPGYGDCDTSLIYQYVNAAGVLRRALEIAEKTEWVKAGDETADDVARHLIESEDRKLLDQLNKDLKEVLAEYSDAALAALLADKRVRDYKESLKLREVWDTRALGSSVWIMDRDRTLREELRAYPSLEQLLASHYAHIIAQLSSPISGQAA